MCMSEPLKNVLQKYDETEVQGNDEVLAFLLAVDEHSRNLIKLDSYLKSQEIHLAKQLREEQQSMSRKCSLLFFDINSWRKIKPCP